ncbi:MAG TPA: alpha/beta hydrolase [Verrucomicrobiae bacterium]|nr:alpha/beta hydrolase [Verrucomicrobiae bacterium]
MKTFKHFDALDADMQLVIKHLLQFKAAPIEDLAPASARNNPTFKNAVDEIASHSAMVRAMNVPAPVLPEKVDRIEHMIIPTRDGEVNARGYFPKSEECLLPVIVYFHGGGWVIADINTYESSCRALCNATCAIVISVGYRQAPENRFPVAANDAYAAVQWVINNAAQFNGDSDRIAVAGESAGGNLATVSCLMAKDEDGKMPLCQLLIYPVTDTSMLQPSYAENEDTQPLHASMMPWFFTHYLDDKINALERYAVPLQTDDDTGLPPAIITTAQFDPLRDEGEQYADKLRAAGVSVKSQRFDGVTHEFFGLSGSVAKAKQALKFAADALKEIFETAEKAAKLPNP